VSPDARGSLGSLGIRAGLILESPTRLPMSNSAVVHFQNLRELWIHTGTACNLECPFCLEGSKPGDSRIERVTLAELKPYFDEAVQLGVERFAFTGGEPLIVKDIVKILSYALELRPCVLLTNGTAPLIKRVHQLELLKQQPHALSFRVSIDYADEALHDAGRGWGNFKKALEGVRLLLKSGFAVALVRQSRPDEDEALIAKQFENLLRKQDLPALPLMSLPELGRPGAGAATAVLNAEDFVGAQPMCAASRMVLKHAGSMHVHACALTDDDDRFDKGPSLAAALTSVAAVHARCAQCAHLRRHYPGQASSSSLHSSSMQAGSRGTFRYNAGPIRIPFTQRALQPEVSELMQKTSVGSRFRSCAAVGGLALSAFFTPAAIAQSPGVVMYFWGVQPQGKLTFASNGDLVGTGSESQISGTAGLYYRVNTNSAGVQTLYEYGRLGIYTGGGPRAGLLLASDNNLYGTTTYNSVDPLRGTQSGVGTIFRMSQDGQAYSKLHEFDPFTRDARNFLINQDGGIPVAGLVEGPDEGGVRYLFGTTFQGGQNGVGTIFKIHPNGTTAPIAIHHFGEIQYVNDAGDVVTPYDPNNAELELQTNKDGGNHYINLDGTNIDKSLIRGPGTLLYGITTNGGVNGTGVIFSIDASGSAIRAVDVLYQFPAPPAIPVDDPLTTDVNEAQAPRVNVEGAYPSSGLVLGPNGLLYGVTANYGEFGFGTVFSFEPVSKVLTTLRSFSGQSTTGPTPGAGASGDLIIDSAGDLVGTFAAGGFRDDAKTVAGGGGIFKIDLDNGNAYTTPYVMPNPEVDPVNAYNFGYAPTTGVIQDSSGNYYGTAIAGGAAGGGSLFKFGTQNANPPLGVPPPYDDGRGSMSLWLLGALLALAGWRLAVRRRNHGAHA